MDELMPGSPIRVLQLLSDNQPGGGMVQMHQFASWVDRDAFHFEFAMPADGPMPESLKDMGETVHAVELGSRFGLSDVSQLMQLCTERGIDVLHSHNVRANVHARVAGWRAGVPVRVSTIHNSVYHYNVAALNQRAYALAERLTLRWCGLGGDCAAAAFRLRIPGRQDHGGPQRRRFRTAEAAPQSGRGQGDGRG